MLPHQAAINARYSGMVAPARMVTSEYQFGVALEASGNAKEALDWFRKSYQRGQVALAEYPQGADVSETEALRAAVIEDGARYAWFLLDIDEREGGEAVIRDLEVLIGRYVPAAVPRKLLVPYAHFENLKSRHLDDQIRQLDEESPRRNDLKKEALQRLRTAMTLALRAAAAEDDPSMSVLRLQWNIYRNMSFDVPAPEKDALQEKACALAMRMIKKNPLDRRAITTRARCHTDRSRRARLKGDLGTAKNELAAAAAGVEDALALVPNDQMLLLLLTDIETDMGEMATETKDRNEHNLTAKPYFVRALKSRTVFQSSASEVKSLYQALATIDFSAMVPKPEITKKSATPEANLPEPGLEVEFYSDIRGAIAQTVDAFPKARGFAYVAADASLKLGVLLARNPKTRTEAETRFNEAIQWFDVSGVLGSPDIFSEEVAIACRAWSERARLHGAAGRVDRMLADIAAMKTRCTPALDKHPWDFYLRSQFIENARRAGEALIQEKRYTDALSHLRYAAHWGNPDSSLLLARLYRDGLGVAKDDAEAATLEKTGMRQRMKRITVPAKFGETSSSFDFFIVDWPHEYRYRGIDDQIQWLKKARNGEIAPEVAESLRKLQDIARANNVSYPEMVAYALTQNQTP
jgi:TPR repeat protein